MTWPTPAREDDLRDIFRVVLRGPVRASGHSYFLPRFQSITVAGHKFGHGDASLTFWEDGHPLVLMLLQLQGFGFSVDVYYNDLVTPLYVGVVKHISTTARVGEPTTITLALEGIDVHIMRRRLNATYANAVSEQNYQPCDNVVLSILSAAVGGAMTPYGYPTTRTNYGLGPVTGVTVASLKSPGHTIMSFGEESGNNVVDIVHPILETYGLALLLTELTPGYWHFDTQTVYHSKDVSNLVIFSETGREIASISRDVDYSALETVICMRGEGAKASQALTWVADPTGVATYGVFEGSGTKSSVTATNQLASQATVDLSKGASPVDTWTIELAERASMILKFNDLYGPRARVGVESWRLAGARSIPGADPVAGPSGYVPNQPISVQVPIVGYNLDAEGYTWPRLRLTLGQPKRNLLWEMRLRTGSRGGRGSGDYNSPNRG